MEISSIFSCSVFCTGQKEKGLNSFKLFILLEKKKKRGDLLPSEEAIIDSRELLN